MVTVDVLDASRPLHHHGVPQAAGLLQVKAEMMDLLFHDIDIMFVAKVQILVLEPGHQASWSLVQQPGLVVYSL